MSIVIICNEKGWETCYFLINKEMNALPSFISWKSIITLMRTLKRKSKPGHKWSHKQDLLFVKNPNYGNWYFNVYSQTQNKIYD